MSATSFSNTVLETLVEGPTDIVEIISPGPQGPASTPEFELPFTTSFMRIKETGELQIFNPDQNKYHTVQVLGAAGAEYLAIYPGET